MKKFFILFILFLNCSKNFVGPTPDPQSISPAQGWTGADTTITIQGRGFSPVVKNTLSGTQSVVLPQAFLLSTPEIELNVIFSSTTEIHAVVPKGAPVGGPYDIKIINPDGRIGILPRAFTVTQEPLILITRIYPNFGWTGSRTTVTITGSGFKSTPIAYLEIGDTKAELENLSFISSSSLSGIIPAGLPVGGPYNLVVVNPDGNAGLLEKAFSVTQNPPPKVTSVTPSSGTTQDNPPVTIKGSDFRQPKVVLINSSYAEVPCNITISSSTSNQIDATFPLKDCGVPAGAYLVRVINQDEGSYYDWSSFVVTNPASNPGFWQPAPQESWLNKGRAGPGVVSGRNDIGETFIYAIAGAGTKTPSQSDIYNDAEVVQVDPFGQLGSWKQIPNKLNSRRFGAGAVQLNGWIYVIGGTSDGSVPLQTCAVEKAKILTTDTSPQNLNLTSFSGGNLTAGAWYYRVSAVMKDTDPENPSGESLPSLEKVIKVPGGSSVKLTWDAPLRNPQHVSHYRIYRTDSENGISNTEHLIVDNVTGTEFTDSGLPPGTVSPLPNGSTGIWQCENTTNFTPRFGLSAVVGHDSNNSYYIYATGGRNSTGATGVVEFAPVNPDGSLGNWTSTASIGTGRYYLSAVFVDSTKAPIVGQNNYIYALGGTQNGTTALNTTERASVQTGGALSSWTSLTKTINPNMGLLSVAVDNFIFDMVGTAGGGNKVDSGEIINPAGDIQNWNNAGNGGTTIWSRFLGGTTLESAYIYLVGGYGKCETNLCTEPTADSALRTVESVIW